MDSKMFGYGKDRKYESFPFDWIKPGERQYDSTGLIIIKGKYITDILAFIRKYILRKPAVFWMKNLSPIRKKHIQ